MNASCLHDREKVYLFRKTFLLALSLLLIFTLFFSLADARDVRVAVQEIKPSIFTDDQGKPAGLFVDIIEDIAAKEDWNIVWVHGTLAENWDRLSSGEIDLMPGVVDTPERDKLYDFNHEPVFSAWSQVYALPGSGINTIRDLDGKRIALLKGDYNGIAFRDYARKFNINTTYLEEDSVDNVLAMTAAGDADAAVAFNLAGEPSASKYGLTETTVMFNPNAVVFAVPKGTNKDLLAAIDRYLAEGRGSPSSSYSRAMQKWFGMKASWTVPSYLWWGLAGIAGLAALFVIMSVVLRREVRKKTKELSRQNEELQSEIASRQRAEAGLIRKNTELHAAYEQLAANEEELRANYRDLHKIEHALMQARKKLNLLNRLTIQEIQSGIFSLAGYYQLAKGAGDSEKVQDYLGKGADIINSVGNSLNFAKKYQDLGINQPRWQDVNYVLINAISHLDFSHISRTMELDGLEIYADPLLEDVFVIIMDNILFRGAGTTEISIRYRQNADSVTILVQDNGPGIPAEVKEQMFEWEYKGTGSTSLFLAREILSITGILIQETGEPGSGARFELTVPEGEYRFSGK
jgi:ABC-type amino acid transport substrate-binding protein/signal transduction histidine kinase